MAVTIRYRMGAFTKSYGKDPRSVPDSYCARDTRTDLVGLHIALPGTVQMNWQIAETRHVVAAELHEVPDEGTDIRGAEGRGHSL